MTTVAMNEPTIVIPEKFRMHMICQTPGRLLVLEQRRTDMEAMSFIQREKMSGSVVEVEYVSAEEMDSIQASTSSDDQRKKAANVEQAQILHLINLAIKAGASDFHITVDHEEDKANIKFRCNGDMDANPRHIETAEKGMAMMRCIYQAMTDVSGTQFKENEQQDASMDRSLLPESLYGVRIAHTPVLNGHYMVGRLLYRGGKLKSFAQLGYHPKQIATLNYLMRIPHGIILFAGVTGSGKSTTLACALSQVYELRKHRVNIITAEDPVEFIIPGAHQIPVTDSGKGREASYGDALHVMLRLDPNVGMISELRDSISVWSAIDMALTGHQVWSTIHAIDVVSVLPRLEMKGIPREVLADNKLITGIVAQSLVKTVCQECSVLFKDYAGEDRKEIEHALIHADIDTTNVRLAGCGCENCQEGYTGRTVLAEVVTPDSLFMHHFLKGDRIAMRSHLRQQGFMTKHEQARLKVAAGLVDLRDVQAEIGPIHQDIIESDSIVSQAEIISAVPSL